MKSVLNSGFFQTNRFTDQLAIVLEMGTTQQTLKPHPGIDVGRKYQKIIGISYNNYFGEQVINVLVEWKIFNWFSVMIDHNNNRSERMASVVGMPSVVGLHHLLIACFLSSNTTVEQEIHQKIIRSLQWLRRRAKVSFLGRESMATERSWRSADEAKTQLS